MRQRDCATGLPNRRNFARALTHVESALAGRAFAACGGTYIVTSLVWTRVVEHTSLVASDWLGAVFCLIGATLILIGPGLQAE